MLLPNEIAKKSIKTGKAKAALPAWKMLLLGAFAGAFIALAGVGATFGNTYGGKIVSACIFPVGLIMVVIAGSELFTGNNLMITSLLKKEITLGKLLKNWGLVFLGNFIGALIITLLVVFSGLFDGIADSVINTAAAKANLSFFEALFRGILCNFLVCIAVWMSFGAETISGKILAIFGPIMLFVFCGFEHSVANMFYGPAGILVAAKNGIELESLNFGTFLVNNLLPVTLGNIIGGAGLVSCGYYLAFLKNSKK
ncbi:formate/nitrite transporter family protein [Candidatus Saccharibacteria bacterium]|nr:formate/nitrite transporter family protein [Candidatus Saccharibacteria bacterium]MBR3121883.1 formate/nitrite transporter family protein [Candidatus Saccharibacteria bacterium]